MQPSRASIREADPPPWWGEPEHGRALEFSRGALFAGHRIEGVAGRGGMGVVYRARDLRLERLVALKVIAPGLAERPEQRARFVSESRAAATVDHPSAVPVLYAGEESGTAFIAMRFVEGPDLRSLVRDTGPLDPARAVRVICQVAGALDAAHARGLVHRDVKPGNVLVDADDRAFLTDFGLTRRIDGSAGDTRTGEWVGTVDYVAPEVIRGLAVDHRADVYALGALLFFVLTGRPPFPRDGDAAVLWAHVHEDPPGPGELRPTLPAGFDDVVSRALAKAPGDRYQTAGDLARAARAALEWTDAPTGSRTRSPRPRRRGRIAGALALAVSALAAVLLPTSDLGGAAAVRMPTPTPPTGPRLAALVPVGERPGEVALTRGRVWVTSARTTTLAGIDPRTTKLASNPGGLRFGTAGATAGFHTIWLINRRTATLIALDPRTHVPAHTIRMPPEPQEVHAGLGRIWVLTKGAPNVLVEVDPRTHAVVRRRTLPGREGAYFAVGHGALYVSNVLANRLLRIDPRTLRITRSVLAGVHPRGVAVGHGAVWVADPPMDTVLRFSYDLARSRVVTVGHRPHAVSAGAAGVWASNLAAGTVVRIDPRRARVSGRPIRVGHGPFAMASTRHRLWVTLVDDNAVARVDVP